jgi:hypothetical protein
MKEELCFCDLSVLEPLGLLDEDGTQQLADACAECPELLEELVAFREAVAAIPYSLPSLAPSADLKDRLLQRITDGAESDAAEPNASERKTVESESPLFPPPLPIPAETPSSLLAAVRSALQVATGGLADTFTDRITVDPQSLIWQPHRVPGVMVAPLYVDLKKREVTALIRAEPGIRYPSHRHAAVEEIFMLEGDLVIGDDVYGPGHYIRSSPESVHELATSVGGCMLLVRTSLNDEYPVESP